MLFSITELMAMPNHGINKIGEYSSPFDLFFYNKSIRGYYDKAQT